MLLTVISLKNKPIRWRKNVAVDRIDERGEKMALRGKRKRKKARRGAAPAQEIQTRGNGGNGRGVTYTKTKRKDAQNRKPNKQPTTPNGAAALITTQRTHKKIAFQKWHI